LSPDVMCFAVRWGISAFFVERFTVSLHQIDRQAGWARFC